VRVQTLVSDRATYLSRPDLGRSLDEASRARLKANDSVSVAGFDVALVVADGLSAQAAQRYAWPLLSALAPSLRAAGFSLAPLVLACHTRVALQDDIGSVLAARSSVILLGERPGLHAPVSLGAYFVFDPKVGTTDERRNCVSNIRDNGLSPAAAAETLLHLLTQSFARRISGVNLKDDRGGASLTNERQ
jgi:ethanolamine ammonia-lyase small subunit